MLIRPDRAYNHGGAGSIDCMFAVPVQRCTEVLRYVLLVNGQNCVLQNLAVPAESALLSYRFCC